MQKNELLKYNESIIRVLKWQQNRSFIIDCRKKNMPTWIPTNDLSKYSKCTEEELLKVTNVTISKMELLDAGSRKFVYDHFSLIAGILPFVDDVDKRNYAITKIAEERNVSKQTIRRYLCLYLAYQNIAVFAPKPKEADKPLSKDEKNFRYALNKYFYNQKKNSLTTVYTLMLKEKYCDGNGKLLTDYPTFYQFRYYYRKNKKLQTYYISRDGIKNYQRNNRPLLGDGIQEFAPNVGIGMLDATVCDIYIVNDAGNLIGRPILTTCIDAYSSLCCGYSLTWEGGTYSLRGLMVNILTDKVVWCKEFGITINQSDWDSNKLPGTFITDMGSEYKSETFEQISERGVTIINLPAYRPELKGAVEKFFDLIQSTYKKHLKGCGVIEPDFQERGTHDYRKDACLTMKEFERIIIRCILYYNSQRIIENYPYTEDMIKEKIQPHANAIYEWGKKQPSANLVSISIEDVILSLLPRTTGRFARNGLIVHKMRYKHENYTEKYLSGGSVTVAYNPEDVSNVWLIENGEYICFELIQGRYKGKELSDIETMQKSQKQIVKDAIPKNTQAQIDLANFIEIIALNARKHDDTNIKGIRNTRKKEQKKLHIDYMKEGAADGQI